MIALPRQLGWGRGVRGPDAWDCINSGAAPVIMKSRNCHEYFDKAFLVGTEYAADSIYDICLAHIRGDTLPQIRKRNSLFRSLRLFKTYAPARKAFSSLCDTMIAPRERDRNKGD